TNLTISRVDGQHVRVPVRIEPRHTIHWSRDTWNDEGAGLWPPLVHRYSERRAFRSSVVPSSYRPFLLEANPTDVIRRGNFLLRVVRNSTYSVLDDVATFSIESAPLVGTDGKFVATVHAQDDWYWDFRIRG